MNSTGKIILIVIFILAALLRFVRLGENPPSIYWDEASLGYNAYSILKTGRDEHGEFLPIARFIAFGDYKPSGYIYTSLPFIAIFGLNEFGIRFASAIAGTLTVVVTYYLANELFAQKNWQLKIQKWTISLAELAALLLTINPWHLQFSHGAFEANLATFFSTTGILYFIKGLKKGKYFVLSSLFFILSMYTFNTHRVFVPLLIVGFTVIYRKAILLQKNWSIISICLGMLLLAPIIPFLFSREGQLRFEEVSIFKNIDPIQIANARISRERNSLIARVIHNRRLQFTLEFAKHYFDHFEPSFLFFSGDVNPRLGTRENGVLYPIELPLLLIGIYVLLKYKHKSLPLLFLWIFMGIIPAATARETPHALRTLNILPAPQLIIASGIIGGYQLVKRQGRYILFLVTAYFLFTIFYLHTYHFHYPYQWSSSWQYGYKQMVQYISSVEDQYDKIFITKKHGRPYIFLLLYKQYSPEKYWQTRDAQRDWFGFWTVNGFDKYRFGDFPQIEERGEEKWLLVSGPDGLPGESKKLQEIKFLNNQVAFEIGEIR